ncbi:MAG TPA: cadmium-translocating P-type ATPase [Devosia sp.]|nr:cadmium-translocating P-type ATPase [Devosia sp.]
MSCCAPGVEAGATLVSRNTLESDDEALMAAARDLGDGTCQLELGVPDVHCATCIRTIERGLGGLDMVQGARVNLSTKRVRVTFNPKMGAPSSLTEAVRRSGHRVMLLDATTQDEDTKKLSHLVRALAVSGFAAGNIMLFSVSVWAGADAATRDLFHWVSALIAIPTVGYSGQVFYRSAIGALRHGRLNMDVPIALAVLLSLIMSVFETARGAENTYFDASVTLLFFLLIGRTLDHMMREKARGAVKNLARMAPRRATLVRDDGAREAIAIADIEPGIELAIAAGQRVPVDGEVTSGVSEADVSLVTGEAVPETIGPGSKLLSGALVLTGAVNLIAEQRAEKSFLARMVELMEAAEGSRAEYRRIADRAAEIYAPAVHLLALIAFLGWGILSGDWHLATIIAIAVLIITCPCALALAVPMVHIVGAGRLFEAGIVMKDGAALERMGEASHVVFDKTGTLTQGTPSVTGQFFGDAEALKVAGQLARLSAHPFSQALGRFAPGEAVFPGDTREVAGEGIEGRDGDGTWRLGKKEWCNGAEAALGAPENTLAQSEVWLSRDGAPLAAFTLADAPRPDAQESIKALLGAGYQVSLLSGDRRGAVEKLAAELGINNACGEMTPTEKVSHIQVLQSKGQKVLMVGDGINDAPALRAATVSMAPASAADVGRSAADFIFTRQSLTAVPATLELARKADRSVRENFAMALVYNIVAVPLAMAGFVTPLLAALAMSTSSILVTVNALKLRLGIPWLAKHPPQERAPSREDKAIRPEPAR